MRAVSSARSTYRPSQKSDSAIRLSMRARSLLTSLESGSADDRGREHTWAVLLRCHDRTAAFGDPAAEDPGVLRSTALARVDDHRPMSQGHSGQRARRHPDVTTVV